MIFSDADIHAAGQMEKTDQNTHDILLPITTMTNAHIVRTTTPENTPSSTGKWAMVLRESQSFDKDLSTIFEVEACRLRKQLIDEIAFSEWTSARSALAIMPPTLDLMSIFGGYALPPMTPALAVPAADLSGTVQSLVDEMLARLQTEGARALRREEWRVFRAAIARQATFEVQLEEQEAALKQWTQASLDAQRAVLRTHYQEHLGAQKASFELQDRAREMQDIRARTALRDEWAARVKRAEDKIGAFRKQIGEEKESLRSSRASSVLRRAGTWSKKVEGEFSQAGKKIHELEIQVDTGKALAEAEEAVRIEAETQLRQATDQIADLKTKLASQTKLAVTEGEIRQAQEQELVQMKKEVVELKNNLALEKKQTSTQYTTQMRVQAELTACQTQLKEAEASNIGLQKRVQDRLLRVAELKGSLTLEKNTSSRESTDRKKAEDALRTARSQMQKQDEDYGKLHMQFEEQSIYVAQLQKENQDMISTLAPIMERFRGSFAGSHPPSTGAKETHENIMSEPYDPYLPRGGSSSNPSGAAPGQGGNNGNPKTAAIQAQIDDTVTIMRDNITKVVERQERLDSLQDKTDNLAVSAQGFRRNANRVRKNMWWKDMKMRIIIGLAIAVIIVIIVVSVVKATKH
ncbi:hypothetical protein EWM64_g5221 [Hericium alpestre]|uniref:V-SNARE coiled-coil homology domain-containing protein n=1 Tax=Hericium alpestre TaxID=135208 RepID=A0A4Y9ZX91_9AGAM|nr:hypothetical protein EWM64_g5221 [Hericium alpestre]